MRCTAQDVAHSKDTSWGCSVFQLGGGSVGPTEIPTTQQLLDALFHTDRGDPVTFQLVPTAD